MSDDMSVAGSPAPPDRSGPFRDTLRQLHRDRLGFAGSIIVAVMVLGALFADVLVPYDPSAIDVENTFLSASWQHWLGTDQLGLDIFSRVIMGGRIAMQVALVSISAALLIGLGLGMMAAFGPRWLDRTLVLLFDTVRSFPTIMFALAVVALVGPSLRTVILVVIVMSIPVYARVVRTQALALRSAEFILAERAMGASKARILSVHVLPNIIGPLLILASMDIPSVVALEAGLSFLGMGVRPPTPSWGSILNDGYTFLCNTPWPLIAAGIPLALITLGFTFLGEALRDIFDPKLSPKR